MATATLAKNGDRVLRRCISLMMQPGGESHARDFAGANTIARLKGKMWVCAGAPSSTAPAGMTAGDWILDTTNSAVYRYVSGTTYAQINTTS